jgi:hypothetical protein
VSENQIIEINAANILCKLIDVWAMDNPQNENAYYNLFRTKYNNNEINGLKDSAVNIAKNIHKMIIEMEAQSE